MIAPTAASTPASTCSAVGDNAESSARLTP